MERCSMVGEEDLGVLLKGCRLSCRDMASITVDGTFTVQRNTNNCSADQSVFSSLYCQLLMYCITQQQQIKRDNTKWNTAYVAVFSETSFIFNFIFKISYLMLRHDNFPHSFVMQHAVHTKITLPNCKMRRAQACLFNKDHISSQNFMLDNDQNEEM